ncbi:histidine phosphatase superfamily (branch 2) [Metarhizium robertsii]|uniref:Histidine phosphatase superfamily, clade-2 n=2 Tax=Metarhizium robertsii TaxID=568076 RepID=E9F2X7_METRA|nr:Histidine phosphatase superfamily, clade-2 [Metarhizium robertsii ARSEF 23]EFY97843.1 Histidine phosphatase superfamily, clade-2 [Metarhizium robertsii ARSEF 23]EXV00411.1 histidine phosphatase superfamily (branch 2) [Metarhizium robertsii]
MHSLHIQFVVLGLHMSHSVAAVVTDIPSIYTSWGELSVYADNAEDAFGVQYVGLPDGCQVESVSTLQRHAERYPDSVDGAVTGGFAQKVANYSKANGGEAFTGPLTFLNSYVYILNDTGLLTGRGASTEFSAGASFWNRYGRTLYNASVAQLQYSPTFASNGSARPKVTLRTTGQSRIENSLVNWSLGFFGPSFNSTPDPALTEWESPFRVVVIPEGGTENNTLASYDSCFNDNSDSNANIASRLQDAYKRVYLRSALRRLQAYAPRGFTFDYQDLYAMQMTCAYEYSFIGMSDFCSLFTMEDWHGFENVLDLQYYYLYSYGNPTGRAQGIGYLQELMARIRHQFITSSNSSVNATLDDNPTTFPLGQQIYADFSHDDIIISVLTAMSLDYLKDAPTTSKFPPSSDNHFTLSRLTPFGANLITEVIGCGASDPEPVESRRVPYAPGQYGYEASNSSYKFVRMRLNNGILPLNTIRGGQCGNATSGRLDGLCALGSFLESQESAFELSNYAFACFGNYTLANSTTGIDYDGTIVQGRDYTRV